jgi:FkbM family methyltransferase
MKRLLRRVGKYGLARFGLRLIRVQSPSGDQLSPPRDRELLWLEELKVRTVLDVGAHVGESAERFRRLFPESRIYSFEPQSDCYLELERAFGRKPNHRCFNLALGDAPGTATMYRSAFSPSSSLRRMASQHKEEFPFTAEEHQITVAVSTLDEVSSTLVLEDPILLKIDTQGFEREVLLGAKRVLPRVRLIVVETSFVPLYEGQPLFPTIYSLMADQGFEYAGSLHQLRSPRDGTPLQQEALFLNRNVTPAAPP